MVAGYPTSYIPNPPRSLSWCVTFQFRNCWPRSFSCPTGGWYNLGAHGWGCATWSLSKVEAASKNGNNAGSTSAVKLLQQESVTDLFRSENLQVAQLHLGRVEGERHLYLAWETINPSRTDLQGQAVQYFTWKYNCSSPCRGMFGNFLALLRGNCCFNESLVGFISPGKSVVPAMLASWSWWV